MCLVAIAEFICPRRPVKLFLPADKFYYPLYFAMKGETKDLFKLAAIVVNNPKELINKATGATLRYGGQRDKKSLLDFLNKHAGTMPRITLRYSLEKLSSDQKAYCMNK